MESCTHLEFIRVIQSKKDMKDCGVDEHRLVAIPLATHQRREEPVPAGADGDRAVGHRHAGLDPGECDVDRVAAPLEGKARATGVGSHAPSPGLGEQRGGCQERSQDMASLEPFKHRKKESSYVYFYICIWS